MAFIYDKMLKINYIFFCFKAGTDKKNFLLKNSAASAIMSVDTVGGEKSASSNSAANLIFNFHLMMTNLLVLIVYSM